ncbi:hypothetical protein CEXT_476461 [Caerostris extrusa]|uniref:Uncharacterized protein n=1 Tax=Caerostris extrusa TaxID=172846 RepID=A0AAV4VWQ7_CAEEX|nr:hypothetical protein CEXT_476461 [Caerostris extrusa]
MRTSLFYRENLRNALFPHRCEQTGKCDPRSAKDQNSKHDLLSVCCQKTLPRPSISPSPETFRPSVSHLRPGR